MSDGRRLKQLYRNGKRGHMVLLEGVSQPLTVSWFWLKRAEGKRELRFVVSTHPYSAVYLVRQGRKRWVIEGFFKTAKHRFGLHRGLSKHNVRGVPLADLIVNCLSTSPPG